MNFKTKLQNQLNTYTIYQNQLSNIIKVSLVFFFALIIAACDETDEFGSDYLPEQDLLDVYYDDSFNCKTYTISDADVRTDGFTTALIGSYIDPVFGPAKAEFAAQLRIASSRKFDLTARVDSVVLELLNDANVVQTITGNDTIEEYKNLYYGKLGTTQKVSVHRLAEDIIYMEGSEPKAYYGHTTFNYEDNPIGTLEYAPQENDSLLRIKLSRDFGQELIDSAKVDSTYFYSNDKFFTLLKGLIVKADNNYVDGAIMGFNLLSSSSKLSIYYHEDTVDSYYNFSLASYYSGRAALFEHDYSATQFYEALQQEEQIKDSVIFIQGMSGVKGKIYFPDIHRLNENGEKIVINKANLIIYPAEMANQDEYPYPEEMVLVYSGEDGKEQYLTEYYDYENSTYSGELYDSNNKYYLFSIPVYLQDILDGKIEDKGLFLIPGKRVSNPSRLVITSETHPTRPMTLKLTYSVLE